MIRRPAKIRLLIDSSVMCDTSLHKKALNSKKINKIARSLGATLLSNQKSLNSNREEP